MALLFSETTAPMFLKLHMQHDQNLGIQNDKFEGGREFNMAASTKYSKTNQIIFSSPEPKAPGELLVWKPPSSVRRPSTLSNDFSSETSGPNITKFHM